MGDSDEPAKTCETIEEEMPRGAVGIDVGMVVFQLEIRDFGFRGATLAAVENGYPDSRSDASC